MKKNQLDEVNNANAAGLWEWLTLNRSNEAVLGAVLRVAHLHPQMHVAVAGPGATMFTESLARSVQQVSVLDETGKWATNLHTQRFDTIIANLFLFTGSDPLEAIRELSSLIKPGGRMVLTGMEAAFDAPTTSEYPRFERSQARTWLVQAGLVNCIVKRIESAGQGGSTGWQTSLPGLFVAVGARRLAGVEEAVRENYAAIAQGEGTGCTPAAEGACCCSDEALISLDSIGGPEVGVDAIFATDYTPEDKDALPSQVAEFSLGCGNPTAFAALQPGEVVLDIGSGGGLDALIAARQVGPRGKVIGVDMTPEMLERARRAADSAGFDNVEFRQGQADALPIETDSVDVIISNCVINLTPDKGQVFQEAWRVLRSGGRLEVSDVVTDIAFPPDMLTAGNTWSGCVTGALPEEEYVDLIQQAGFSQVQVHRSKAAIMGGVRVYSAQVSARKCSV